MDRIKKRIERERTLGKVILSLGMLLLMGIVAGTGINHVRKDFRIAFKQHMFPTLDIFHAVERQYQNRYLVDELITGTGRKSTQLVGDIRRNNKIIDSIANHYITGHQVENVEEQDFKAYLVASNDYRKLENKLISLCNTNKSDSARILYQSKSQELFSKAVAPIDRLEDDQMVYITQIYNEAEDTGRQVSSLIYIMGMIGTIYAIWLAIRYARQHLAE
jgi:hypothetical protein